MDTIALFEFFIILGLIVYAIHLNTLLDAARTTNRTKLRELMALMRAATYVSGTVVAYARYAKEQRNGVHLMRSMVYWLFNNRADVAKLRDTTELVAFINRSKVLSDTWDKFIKDLPTEAKLQEDEKQLSNAFPPGL